MAKKRRKKYVGGMGSSASPKQKKMFQRRLDSYQKKLDTNPSPRESKRLQKQIGEMQGLLGIKPTSTPEPKPKLESMVDQLRRPLTQNKPKTQAPAVDQKIIPPQQQPQQMQQQIQPLRRMQPQQETLISQRSQEQAPQTQQAVSQMSTPQRSNRVRSQSAGFSSMGGAPSQGDMGTEDIVTGGGSNLTEEGQQRLQESFEEKGLYDLPDTSAFPGAQGGDDMSIWDEVRDNLNQDDNNNNQNQQNNNQYFLQYDRLYQ